MKLLLLCNRIKDIAVTLNEHIDSFKQYSQYQVDIIDCQRQKPTIDFLNNYDAIIIHYSLWVELDYNLSPISRFVIASYNGPKIIFLQDENRHVNNLLSCLHALGVNIIFTCVPDKEIYKVYSKSKFPGVKVVNTRTGFVPQELLHLDSPGYNSRDLDVVYRARKLSAWFGRLCYEKYSIADKFNIDAKKYNLKVDISALESDRIHGSAWFDFLLSSKATLGVESGASMFDFTGKIRNRVERHELLYPETSFDELEQLYFPKQDYNVIYNQISPRHFEAAALRTMMILYEGEYSNVLTPWRHYVPLKKDHSNMEQVVSILRDPKQWQEITDNCYNEVALNPEYTYPSFIRAVDKVIRNYFDENSIVIKAELKSSDESAKEFAQSEHLAAVDNIVSKDKVKLEQKTYNEHKKKLNSNLNTQSDGFLSAVIDTIIRIKKVFRQSLAKIYWKLDRFCNLNKDSENILVLSFGKIIRAFKNTLKLIDMRFRNYNKSNSKLIIIINSIYYKIVYKKPALFTVYDIPQGSSSGSRELLFCLDHDNHNSCGSTNAKFKKTASLRVVFKKVKVCDNCKWFIGF